MKRRLLRRIKDWIIPVNHNYIDRFIANLHDTKTWEGFGGKRIVGETEKDYADFPYEILNIIQWNKHFWEAIRYPVILETPQSEP